MLSPTLDNTNTNTNTYIYYNIHHTSSVINRTGAQVVAIYLAKQFINKNKKIIFVKWSNDQNALVPCNHIEINHFFNYNEITDIIDYIYYDNYNPIHITNNKINESIFFSAEVIFDKNIAVGLNNYLVNYSIKSIYILHDIIPMIIDDYISIKYDFSQYLLNNILTAAKIIPNSNFTKTEFINYCNKEKLLSEKFPIIKSILLPYQYRNKNQITNNKNTNNKFTILLPGTIEPRKQQILFMKLFNKFCALNPSIDIELITFGNVCDPNVLNMQINESNNKIKYLGLINNETLCDLYKTADLSCFLSYYEGYGFPISESLWHNTPVLTANFGSMSEIAKHGGCYCIDTTNKNEIYDALNYLVKNPEILIKLKKEISNTNFSTWSDYADKIYEEIILISNKKEYLQSIQS